MCLRRGPLSGPNCSATVPVGGHAQAVVEIIGFSGEPLTVASMNAWLCALLITIGNQFQRGADNLLAIGDVSLGRTRGANPSGLSLPRGLVECGERRNTNAQADPLGFRYKKQVHCK